MVQRPLEGWQPAGPLTAGKSVVDHLRQYPTDYKPPSTGPPKDAKPFMPYGAPKEIYISRKIRTRQYESEDIHVCWNATIDPAWDGTAKEYVIALYGFLEQLMDELEFAARDHQRQRNPNQPPPSLQPTRQATIYDWTPKYPGDANPPSPQPPQETRRNDAI